MQEPDKAAAWYEKPLHGAWHKGVAEVADMTSTYQWLKKSNIKANTEALIMAAQDQALKSRYLPLPTLFVAYNCMCLPSFYTMF